MTAEDDPIAVHRKALIAEITALVARDNQHVAASALGIDQPRMSDLQRGVWQRFSMERLIRLLLVLNRRVELTVIAPKDPRVFAFRLIRERIAREGIARVRKPRTRVKPWNVGKPRSLRRRRDAFALTSHPSEDLELARAREIATPGCSCQTWHEHRREGEGAPAGAGQRSPTFGLRCTRHRNHLHAVVNLA